MFLADALDTQVKPAYDAKSAAAPCATACAWASRHICVVAGLDPAIHPSSSSGRASGWGSSASQAL